MNYSTTTHTTGHGLIARLKGLASFPLATLFAWNEKNQTRKALNNLSTRQLEDIGLCRGDIDDMFR
ncbi:MAG: DUF1127 domain-containing protein [Paracoccaceae bacterium]